MFHVSCLVAVIILFPRFGLAELAGRKSILAFASKGVISAVALSFNFKKKKNPSGIESSNSFIFAEKKRSGCL